MNRGPNGSFSATRVFPYAFSGLWPINRLTPIIIPRGCRLQHGDTSTESIHKEVWSQSIRPLQCHGLSSNIILRKLWLVMTHWHISCHLHEKYIWHWKLYITVLVVVKTYDSDGICFFATSRYVGNGNTTFSISSKVVMWLPSKPN